MSLVQLLEPKGLYVAGWVHRVNGQNKQVEFCDDQEFMPREYEMKNGKVANQAYPNVCDCAFGNAAFQFFSRALFGTQLSFQPKKTTVCRLLSSGVTRRLHTRSGCMPAGSLSGCTFPFLFNILSTFGVFTRRSGQRSRSSRRLSHMLPLPRPRPKPIAGRSHRPRVIHPQEVCLARGQ